MEKFALLDFLKAFQSLTAKRSDAADVDTSGEKEQVNAPQTAPNMPQTVPQTAAPMRNPMADVIARHEEIANRIRNKK